MKITSVIVLLSVSLCASLCCSEDDDYITPRLNIDNDTIITVQNNQNTFTVNDYLYINTTIFNSQVTNNGSNVQLSNYDYGEVNQSFYHSNLALYKRTNFGTVVKIPLLPEHISIITGDAILENDSRITLRSYFDGAQYRSAFGIQLLEAGNYFIADAYSNSEQVLFNGGDYNLSYVTIASKIVNSNTNGEYEFTVTE